MEHDLTPALIAVLGSIGVGLIGIAAAMFFRTFKSPVQQTTDLALAIQGLREEVLSRVTNVQDDHHELARSVAVLANEVSHLSSNVKTLGDEVKNMWRSPRNSRNVG